MNIFYFKHKSCLLNLVPLGAELFYVFNYTPKHASWMNQVEVWFGVLTKKVIVRGSFKSTEAVKEKIMSFIDYFNKTMAKPFQMVLQNRAWAYGLLC